VGVEAAPHKGRWKGRALRRLAWPVSMVREISGEERMLRIQRSENGEVIFTLSGQMDEEPIAELERLINSERNGRRIVLDLKDLTLVNENAITFLERCESSRITLENCPPYIREWIKRQRRES
jgi:Fe-S cluster assembly iron-binding protein IscA